MMLALFKRNMPFRFKVTQVYHLIPALSTQINTTTAAAPKVGGDKIPTGASEEEEIRCQDCRDEGRQNSQVRPRAQGVGPCSP